MCPDTNKLKVQGKDHVIEKYKRCLKGKMYLFMLLLDSIKYYSHYYSCFLKDKGFSNIVAVLTRLLKNNFCRLLLV